MSDRYLNKIMGDRENIILVSRQHWIVLFQSITINLLFALVIVGVATGIYYYALKNILVFLLLGLLGIPMVRLLNHYMNWLNEEYVVTNFRVIQLRGVFSKNVIDSSLEKVNDVKLAQTFIGRIFNYGDIEILTASELGVNLFEKILNPIQFKTTMQNAKEALEYKPPEPAVAIQKEDIVGLISKLDHLHLDGTISDDEFKIKKAELMARL
jgi:uncharacterized membrane protein YdbT with pleckstrin-like domain